MKFYSVTIWSSGEALFEPWTSVFSSMEKAAEFQSTAQRIIDERNLDLLTTFDSGAIDNKDYLRWLNEF